MHIEITAADQHTLNAYVVGPEDAQHGLVVVQEIFGVNSHMRHVADTFAQQGYRVICPAIFDRAERDVELGYQSDDVQRGLALRDKIAVADTLLDLEAAAAALGKRTGTGIVGYCWGGTLSWLAATRSNRFTAASCWYGGGIAKVKDETPQIPVQMHFGLHDQSIPVGDIDAIRSAQPQVDIHTYQADHGFGCEQRASFQPEASKLALERTLEFFKINLG
ncbi:MAG: dienelactone hydrolase family protein [Burkholderiaceae bacterium]|nr:dienelactone hydrolase family protein [Burkholderiaceae bacterium]